MEYSKTKLNYYMEGIRTPYFKSIWLQKVFCKSFQRQYTVKPTTSVYKKVVGNLTTVIMNHILKWTTQGAVNFFWLALAQVRVNKLIKSSCHVRQPEQPKWKLWNILKALSKNKKDVVFPLLKNTWRKNRFGTIILKTDSPDCNWQS